MPQIQGPEWGRGLFLRRTGGRAGVGQGAGLLLLLRRAVGLQGRHGDRRVLALGGAALAAELLAFDFPEVVAVVKPGKQRKYDKFQRFTSLKIVRLP